MVKNFRAAALAVVLGLTCVAPGFCTGGPFKVGYLDLDKLKREYPEAQRAEILKLQAESQLKEVLNNANDQVQKAIAAKKDAAEIEKMKRDLQLQLNGMQEGMRAVVGTQTMETNGRIVRATNEVAKESGLDMIVEKNNVFAGGDKLISCEDVTDAVIKRLNGNAPAKPTVAPAK